MSAEQKLFHVTSRYGDSRNEREYELQIYMCVCSYA